VLSPMCEKRNSRIESGPFGCVLTAWRKTGPWDRGFELLRYLLISSSVGTQSSADEDGGGTKVAVRRKRASELSKALR